jgi:NAD(P)-dependent dehydrogenase (short-subunit alcohol dehydrogenase family)
MELQNKIAIITGGGTGIGKATAVLFASQGAKVVIAGRRKPPLASTEAEVRAKGGTIASIVTDVADPGAVRNLFSEAEKLFGRIDILLTCAGVFVSGKETQDFTDEEWDRTMNTNFRGTMLCATRVVPYMKKIGGGVIINCTSVSGRVAQRMQTPYNVSKAAVEMMSKCMALELGKYNIRVNSICPSLTDTDMAAAQIAARGREACAQSHPIQRLGEPQDMAYAALYLASNRASWVSGNSLSVDGGYSSR